MATNETLIPVPGRLHSVADGGHLAGADEIYDDDLQKLQSDINADVKVMGASGSNHSKGLVPDPGATAGTSKFLREDATWQNVPAVQCSTDTGEGVIPVDGIRLETVSAGATISVNPDVVTVISGNVGTSTITLQVPNDNLAHVWDILMTTGSNVAVSIAMSNSATIKYSTGFALRVSESVELNIVGAGSNYYLLYGKFD